MSTRKPYPSDVSDEEWAFVAPYLTLMTEDAPQREYPLREVFHGLRWIIRAGAPWRMRQSAPAAMGSGLPADPALAEGRRVRGHRERLAPALAGGPRTHGAADGSDLG